MRSLKFTMITLGLFSTLSASAQDMWKYFQPEDFEKRRARVMEKIGDGVAVLMGAELPEAYVKFRQDNNFYYLTGVEMPGAVLILNGKTKTSTLLVPDKRSGDIRDEAQIVAGPEAAQRYKMSSVGSRSALTSTLAGLANRKNTFWIQTSPEETAEMSRDRCIQLRTTWMADPWDGRVGKEVMFMKNLKERFPLAKIEDLTPIMDEMRWVKDEKEIAVLRACGALGAKGFDEAMRVTRPGTYEYQVVAATDFIYCDGGAFGPAYFAIAASGPRGLSWHYNANNHQLTKGDVILLDYAPEVNYYTTDITRTWPVEGEFTPTQLKFYNCLKEVHETVIAAMKPGVMIKDLVAIAKTVFVKHGLEKYHRNGIGHFVGMAVHDVGPTDKPFVPGVVFNVEPIIEDKDLKIHLRLEDTIVITANGHENVTKATTTEPKEIYKLIKQKGIGEN